jgi:hypothetical protein
MTKIVVNPECRIAATSIIKGIASTVIAVSRYAQPVWIFDEAFRWNVFNVRHVLMPVTP